MSSLVVFHFVWYHFQLSRVNPEAVREATKVLGELCSAVDEANEISEDLKPVHK